MSRSYKHHPFITDNCNSGYGKRIANRVCRRRLKNVDGAPPRSYFKRLTNSYDICDYKWGETKAEAIQWYETQASDYIKKKYPTLEKWLNYWAKCYERK